MNKYTTRAKYSTTINKEILEKFKKLADDTRIPASRLIDEAFEDLLKKYEKVKDNIEK